MYYSGEVLTNVVIEQQDVVSDTALFNVNGLSYTGPNVASGGSGIVFRLVVPFELAGAASGYKFLLDQSAGTIYSLTAQIFDSADNLVRSVYQTAPANIEGAAAAGQYFLILDGYMKLTGAASAKLQFAQFVSDAAAISILPGAYIQIVLSA